MKHRILRVLNTDELARPASGVDREWLVGNGLGGYASGTVLGKVTRRYHGLLIAALPAPLGRLVMVSGVADFGYLADSFCRALGLGPKVNQRLRREIERGYFDGDHTIWDRFSVATGKTPLLVVHNDEDDVVDPEQARVLLLNYGEQAHFHPTTGLGHSRILQDPAVIAEAVAFLQDSDVSEGLDLSA